MRGRSLTLTPNAKVENVHDYKCEDDIASQDLDRNVLSMNAGEPQVQQDQTAFDSPYCHALALFDNQDELTAELPLLLILRC